MIVVNGQSLGSASGNLAYRTLPALRSQDLRVVIGVYLVDSANPGRMSLLLGARLASGVVALLITAEELEHPVLVTPGAPPPTLWRGSLHAPRMDQFSVPLQRSAVAYMPTTRRAKTTFGRQWAESLPTPQTLGLRTMAWSVCIPCASSASASTGDLAVGVILPRPRDLSAPALAGLGSGHARRRMSRTLV